MKARSKYQITMIAWTVALVLLLIFSALNHAGAAGTRIRPILPSATASHGIVSSNHQ